MDRKEHERRKEALEAAAKPLIDYLYEYGTPHDCVIVGTPKRTGDGHAEQQGY